MNIFGFYLLAVKLVVIVIARVVWATGWLPNSHKDDEYCLTCALEYVFSCFNLSYLMTWSYTFVWATTQKQWMPAFPDLTWWLVKTCALIYIFLELTFWTWHSDLTFAPLSEPLLRNGQCYKETTTVWWAVCGDQLSPQDQGDLPPPQMKWSPHTAHQMMVVFFLYRNKAQSVPNTF